MAGLIRHTEMFTSFGRFIVLCEILLVPHLSKAADSSRLVTTEMSWWDARTHCKDEYNRDLFIPDVVISEENPFNLEQNKYYWVGAMETSQWRWTDNTPLFEYLGYVIIDDVFQTSTYIPGNCVTECYRHCYSAGRSFHHIGLSKSACYCLPSNSYSVWTGDVAEKPCPGNSEEKCGNNIVMSVYNREVNFDIQHNEHQCAYAWKTSQYLIITTDNCHKSRYSVCSNDGKNLKYSRCFENLCVLRGQASWHSSNQSCSLVKVASVNRGTVFEFILYGFSYWVGLQKTVTKMWNNKTLVSRPYLITADEGQKCLALLYEDNTGLTAEWRPCSEEHSALCSNNEHNTGPPRTLSTSENPVTADAENVTSPDVNTKSATGNKMDIVEDNNHGIYIGVGIGVLMMLALFFGLTLFFKRNKRLCFKTNVSESPLPNPETESRHQVDLQDQTTCASANIQLSTRDESFNAQPNVTNIYSDLVRLDHVTYEKLILGPSGKGEQKISYENVAGPDIQGKEDGDNSNDKNHFNESPVAEEERNLHHTYHNVM